MPTLTPGISCLIPFYNEGSRLLDVLEVMARVSGLIEIICVDDGSHDQVHAQIPRRWPAVRVVRLPHNQGKAAAIARGLRQVRTEWVLLLDADLTGLVPAELEHALHTVRHRPDLDMLILRRLHAPWLVKRIRGDVLLSGERLMRRRDLAAVLTTPVVGFQLEVALNAYMQAAGKRVGWLPWSAVNPPKWVKRGPVRGVFADLAMYTNVLRFAGLRPYARQLAGFARQRIWSASAATTTASAA